MTKGRRIKPNGWLHFFGFISVAMAGVMLTADEAGWVRWLAALLLGGLGMALTDLAYRHGKDAA